MLEKVKGAYKLWHVYLPHFPKTSRYTLGGKIDSLFVEIIEATSTAAFLSKTEKLPLVRKAISKLDTLNIFLQIAWEIKALDSKKYIALSEPLNEVGKMFGGWHNQLVKQNSPGTGEK